MRKNENQEGFLPFVQLSNSTSPIFDKFHVHVHREFVMFSVFGLLEQYISGKSYSDRQREAP